MLRVKNWSEFQHFRDRRPLWIKLYGKLLDDKQFHDLDGESAKILIELWLVASEQDVLGTLPPISDIAFRIREPEEKIGTAVKRLSHWLEQDDIAPISEPKRLDALEKRRDKEEKEESAPEGLSELQYARGIIEELRWAESNLNFRTVGEAINAVARDRGVGKDKAYEWLRVRVNADKNRGLKITGFYFQEGRYNESPVAKNNGLPSDYVPVSQQVAIETERRKRELENAARK